MAYASRRIIFVLLTLYIFGCDLILSFWITVSDRNFASVVSFVDLVLRSFDQSLALKKKDGKTRGNRDHYPLRREI